MSSSFQPSCFTLSCSPLQQNLEIHRRAHLSENELEALEKNDMEVRCDPVLGSIPSVPSKSLSFQAVGLKKFLSQVQPDSRVLSYCCETSSQFPLLHVLTFKTYDQAIRRGL